MQKKSGAMCPKCYELFPAEHAQLNQPPRWTCNSCGASGELTGSLSIRQPAPSAPPAPPKAPPPWARNLTKAA